MCYPTAILLLSYCYPTVRPRRDHETVTEGVLSGYLSGTKKGAPDGVPLVIRNWNRINELVHLAC